MKALLISTYELGHQPFGLASPAALLRRRRAEVRCLDLSRQPLDEQAVREADLVAFYVPMHTATRLATRLLKQVKALNSRAHLCFYGLYAPVNETYLRELGVHSILGGEFEQGIERLAIEITEAQSGDRGASGAPIRASRAPVISFERINFAVPDRSGLPPLSKYARVILPEGRALVAGYTEASRGCKHLCRHCPIVPVYGGVFRIVPREVVLGDIRQQVEAGAEHVTFGDPDFFNGPAHALAITEALHREFPRLSYDVTIKVEHLLRHREHLARLRDTGCLFVTAAVESVDDAVLARLDKGHTRADFLAVTRVFREMGMVLHPTFVPFTPWTTPEGYMDLLQVLAEEKLVENVAPIQLGIRLLIPAGSRLLELNEVRGRVGAFDPAALVYPWKHDDPRVDLLAERAQDLASAGAQSGLGRAETFARIWSAAAEVQGDAGRSQRPPSLALPAKAIPHLSEAWYCCAEPTREQFVALAAGGQAATEPAVTREPHAGAFV